MPEAVPLPSQSPGLLGHLNHSISRAAPIEFPGQEERKHLQISIRIAAVASLSSLVLVAASSITAFAAPNPDNHGHHYGQLKHHRVTSPPPAPVPVPTPHPIVQPSPNVAPVIHTPRAGNVSAVQPAPVSAPSNTIAPPEAPVIQLSQAADSAGQVDWLLLLIVPTLLAVWLIAFAGLARRLSGARKKALQVQTAPA